MLSSLLPLLLLGGPVNLYVAPDGNDAWTGRRAVVNAKHTDGPFATLERARDAIRELRRDGKVNGAVTVSLRAGRYERTKSFTLKAEDGGTAEAPVTYRAYGKEEARITGGKVIGGFGPVTDPASLARIDDAAKGHVLQTSLPTQGVTAYGALTSRGFGRPGHVAGLELFFRDKPMTLARWPNGTDWTHVVTAPAGPDGGKFTYEGDRPARWTKADDVWLHGYWGFDWADTYEKVKSIDPATRTIETVPPHGVYGYNPGKRYYALNLLEELDQPGEWYLDRATGVLYFWPPAPITPGSVSVSRIEEPLIRVETAAYINLRGFTLEQARGAGVVVSGGSHVVVSDCLVRDIGNTAISIEGGKECGVDGCHLYDLEETAIAVAGGDRKTLVPGSHFATNNHIHDYSTWARTYHPGVLVNGVGNRVANNRIHDAPHNAILMSGNEHVVEYNDISMVCLETGDAGAFYIGRDWTMRGNVVRYNFFHELRGVQGQQGFTDVMGVYLDDCASGSTVFGNIFYKAGRGVLAGGGRDNIIDNNVFVDCNPAIHVDARATGWAAKFAAPGGEWGMYDKLKWVDYKEPPYSSRYPRLATMLEDEPNLPKGTAVTHNIFAGSGKRLELQDKLDDKTLLIRDNLMDEDPLFVDAAKQDFRLKPGSPAFKLGFKPIPVKQIVCRCKR